MLEKLVALLNVVAYLVNATYRTRSLTFARLHFLVKRTPRFIPGTFRFPFGNVSYVDVQSLSWQYSDIFVRRVYEVAGLDVSPYIVDCGGNIGLSVIWFKQRYPHARITVFEADPTIAQVLARNVRTLGLQGVEVVKAAVAASSGPVHFLPDGADGGRVATGSGITVDSVRLSDHIGEPVHLLKVDIEGSEFSVLGDLYSSGKMDFVQNIALEVHGYGEGQDRFPELWAILRKAGFYIVIQRSEVDDPPPAGADVPPFVAVTNARFFAHLYAWRP